jgi:hypothetical protein
MNPPELLLASALGLAMTAIGTQAQEYQSQRTVSGPGYRQTTYEDGSTTTTTWHVNNITGQITNEETVRTHATPAVIATPVPVATNPFHTAHSVSTQQPIVVTAPVQAPVVVMESAEAEMKAASIAGAARVKAEIEQRGNHLGIIGRARGESRMRISL